MPDSDTMYHWEDILDIQTFDERPPPPGYVEQARAFLDFMETTPDNQFLLNAIQDRWGTPVPFLINHPALKDEPNSFVYHGTDKEHAKIGLIGPFVHIDSELDILMVDRNTGEIIAPPLENIIYHELVHLSGLDIADLPDAFVNTSLGLALREEITTDMTDDFLELHCLNPVKREDYGNMFRNGGSVQTTIGEYLPDTVQNYLSEQPAFSSIVAPLALLPAPAFITGAKAEATAESEMVCNIADPAENHSPLGTPHTGGSSNNRNLID